MCVCVGVCKCWCVCVGVCVCVPSERERDVCVPSERERFIFILKAPLALSTEIIDGLVNK